MPDGQWESGEPGMEGVTINLDGTDGWGVIISSSTLTMADGMFWFEDLKPGSYTVSEVQPEGTVPTTDTSSGPHDLMSGQRLELGFIFGNFVGPCNGLTPGYWKNWDNHYNPGQFATLLEGTIADVGNAAQNRAEADAIFDHWDAADPQDLTILKAFTLATQLTLNLTGTGLPNPSEGNLFEICTLASHPELGPLGDALADALSIIAAGTPSAVDPQVILDVKNILDKFANQFTGSL